MGASFTVSLPLEMVADIQRSRGLEKALQKLSLTEAPEDRAVYDMARLVVHKIKALSDVPAPKSLVTTESVTVYSNEDATPDPSVRSTTTFSGTQNSAARPSSAPADPFVPVSKSDTCDPDLPVAGAKRSSPPLDEAIHITIIDHAMGEKQDMVAYPEDTFVTVTQRYTSMVGRAYHNMSFSFEDGNKIPVYALGCDRFQAERVCEDADCALSLRALGITNQRRNMIHACEGTIDITVSNPTDLSSHDEIFGFPVATQFGKLARVYAGRIGIDVYELKLSTLCDNVEWEIHSDLWRQSLHQLDISDGDTITVKPNTDDSHDMTFTLRYAMHKTTSITLASTETVFVTNGVVLDVRPYKWTRQTPTDQADSYTREDYADDDTGLNRSPGSFIRQTQAEVSQYSNSGVVAESGNARCVSPDSDTPRIFQDYARDVDPMVKWQQSQLASDTE
ncbi:hypothetical protein LTR33_007273 [Friedmanniomyces endolithicus]|nr:hypothetical protein LTR33_007273 [Friedmanniomyces endolithicus]